jgi:hypothetical protein
MDSTAMSQERSTTGQHNNRVHIGIGFHRGGHMLCFETFITAQN